MTDKEKLRPFHQMTDELTDLFKELEAADGELTPEMEEKLAGLTKDRREKAQRIIQFAHRLEANAKLLKDEAAWLAGMAKSRLNTAAGLKTYLLNEMRYLGEKTLTTDWFRITRQKAAKPSVALPKGFDLETLAEELVKEIPKKLELDKAAVLEMLKDSGEIPEEGGTYEIEGFTVTVKEFLRIS
jgi:hypothetical protein